MDNVIIVEGLIQSEVQRVVLVTALEHLLSYQKFRLCSLIGNCPEIASSLFVSQLGHMCFDVAIHIFDDASVSLQSYQGTSIETSLGDPEFIRTLLKHVEIERPRQLEVRPYHGCLNELIPFCGLDKDRRLCGNEHLVYRDDTNLWLADSKLELPIARLRDLEPLDTEQLSALKTELNKLYKVHRPRPRSEDDVDP